MTALIGVAVGAVAELILAVHELRELVLTILLGVAGALVTRYVGVQLGWYDADEPAAFLAPIIGAIVALLSYGALFRKWLRSRQGP